jgi:hypothetical protein
MSHSDRCAWKGIRLTIAALALSTGLAWAECPTGLGGGITYGVDIRGVLTLTACDQTWLRGVESGRLVRIKVGAMTVVTEPGDRLQLRGGGISLKPPGIPTLR